MLFVFPDIKSDLTIRQIHTTAAYWFLILMAVHLGAQWTRFCRMLKKMTPVLPEGLFHIYVMWLVQIAIVALGIGAYAVVTHNIFKFDPYKKIKSTNK